MKRFFLTIIAVLGVLTISSCRKETIIERVEVQKGNLILSGIGQPDPSLGNIGDYYLDTATSNLYGGKTSTGWGTPINLRGIQGEKGEKGGRGEQGATGAQGQKGEKGERGEQGATGAQGQRGEKGERGEQGTTGAQGQKGEKGERGEQGERGIPGQNGSKIYTGEKAPTNNIGNEGDWYIDSQNRRLYGPKTNNSWNNSFIDLKTYSLLPPPSVIKEDDFQITSSGLYWRNKLLENIDMNSNEKLKQLGSIPEKTFQNYYNLKAITLSENLTNIGDKAFANCHSLISVEFSRKISVIGEAAFRGCTNLKIIELPNTCTQIGILAFAECINVESVILPNRLEIIKSNTFMSCLSLKKVTIPASVKKIELGAFSGCSINTIIFESLTPIEKKNLGDSYITLNPIKDIYVPAESIEKYKKEWYSLKDKIRPIP